MKRPSGAAPRAFTAYEEVAAYLLGEIEAFGLHDVKPHQELSGAAGTPWALDAMGYTDAGGAIIIECRRKVTRRVEQEDLGGWRSGSSTLEPQEASSSRREACRRAPNSSPPGSTSVR